MSDPERKKYFLSMYDKASKNSASEHSQNGHAYPGFRKETEIRQEEEGEYEGEAEASCVLTDEIDHQILMNRDAHFGGDFDVMLAYYSNLDNIGINPDFDVERIHYLSEIEKEMGQDLAPLILSGAEAEAISRARQSYAQFKEIYETENEKNPFPRLIANLILTDDEEPFEEIEAVVSQGTAIVPDLLALLKSDDMYDPLFPGYGYAPYLAIICLGQIGDSRAIIPIFETFEKQIVFDEMVIVDALVDIGKPAKEFLIKVVKGRPLTHDNLHAAFSLISFSLDPQVAIVCFEQLQDSVVQETSLLSSYLLFSCQVLNKTPYRDAFIKMANDPSISLELRAEVQHIINEWK